MKNNEGYLRKPTKSSFLIHFVRKHLSYFGFRYSQHEPESMKSSNLLVQKVLSFRIVEFGCSADGLASWGGGFLVEFVQFGN